jgi:hypothetical protein
MNWLALVSGEDSLNYSSWKPLLNEKKGPDLFYGQNSSNPAPHLFAFPSQ